MSLRCLLALKFDSFLVKNLDEIKGKREGETENVTRL